MKKKIGIIIAMLLLTLTLTACPGDDAINNWNTPTPDSDPTPYVIPGFWGGF